MNKLPKTNTNLISLCLIGVSLAGLSLLTALTFCTPASRADFSWQNPAIGSAFGIICLLGIIAGVYPSKCSRVLHFRKETQGRKPDDSEQKSTIERIVTFEGHHPNCGNFSMHLFQLNDRKYCAGCTGLVIGAIISVLGTLVYFSTGPFLGEIAMVFFWLGFVGVALGLLQYNLFNRWGSFVHLSLNVLFVTGAFLLLVGIKEIANNLILEVYFLTLTLYWIFTRILLSEQEHKRICAACGLKFCSFLD